MKKRIMGFWKNTKNGKEYLSGKTLEGKRYFIYENTYKKGKDPDYIMYEYTDDVENTESDEVPF